MSYCYRKVYRADRVDYSLAFAVFYGFIVDIVVAYYAHVPIKLRLLYTYTVENLPKAIANLSRNVAHPCSSSPQASGKEARRPATGRRKPGNSAASIEFGLISDGRRCDDVRSRGTRTRCDSLSRQGGREGEGPRRSAGARPS